ncbi:hypothetical protein K493DRAFT_386911 [Basidiobolus meristosporus CBS 931.73]|uniref:Extracellular membrane protein CFEM domain-containing protein n=1 Tax=Basidiobolus meristosporus CBS 931.73 TaxID=1314790 RepID=A0A1Y1XHW6_9FUNG|nr:hypothetical protein K493DRAFT_386911 [Basidiobolus meristosporus CBS 931.73]|eukprot:ORX85292.1 hypothetical protein K493DRAFT_386911 [Basidiobolus meristosporus CBS 931.73]
MKFSIIICALVTMLCVSKAVEATCAAQTVFDACIQRGKDMFNACSDQDYACKCQRQKDIRLCYDNCKDDPTITSQGQIQDGLVTTYCALVPSSTSSSAGSTSTGTQASLAPSSPSASSATGSTPSNTNTPPTITPNSTSKLAAQCSGLLMAVGILVHLSLS